MPPTTTVLRPLGTPLPVGFLGLAAGAFIVSALQLDRIPPHERHAVAAVLKAVAFPLQLPSSAAPPCAWLSPGSSS
ncbi:hypothetical protein [Streptomyces sp. NPDC004267]|uniref:hypothetical protein n=1 Tax=Streptomyces sp. NPDC004267 TaxID=3364694 RepID=UPI00369D90DB